MRSIDCASKLRCVALAATCLALGAAAYAGDIIQTTNAGSSNDWNDPTVWGGSAPTAGNAYFSASGLASTTNDKLNYDIGTGRVRSLGENTFGGDSLTISNATELLMKQQNSETATANIILDGGLIRYSPNTGSFSFTPTLAGTLTIASESYIGIEHTATSTLTIASTLLGSGTLDIRAGSTAPSKTIAFSGDISGFTGTLKLGGGEAAATLDFAQDYSNSALTLAMGEAASADILNLSHNLVFGAFTYNSVALSAGTYSAGDLNGLFGNGSQFTGVGSLTVGVPEPSTVAAIMGAAGLLFAIRRRKRR